uniref:Uncharacterized protein n=1 Tax=Arundo donax TaxID=35708 RepID=A0A0A8YSK7_ARUDO
MCTNVAFKISIAQADLVIVGFLDSKVAAVYVPFVFNPCVL